MLLDFRYLSDGDALEDSNPTSKSIKLHSGFANLGFSRKTGSVDTGTCFMSGKAGGKLNAKLSSVEL